MRSIKKNVLYAKPMIFRKLTTDIKNSFHLDIGNIDMKSHYPIQYIWDVRDIILCKDRAWMKK